MARSKIKNWDAQDWSQREATRETLMSDLGLARIDNGEEITGRGGYDTEAEEAAIARAFANNYDVRESMKYGRDVDNKHFKDLGKGISNMSEVTSALRAMQKYGKKELDIKANSANDSAQIAQDLFEKSRDDLISSMKVDDEQTKTSITPDVTEEPYEKSPQLAKQEEIVADWEEGYGSGNLSPYRSNFQDMAYDPTEATPYRATTDVNEFVSNYKNGVKDVFQFRPTIA